MICCLRQITLNKSNIGRGFGLEPEYMQESLRYARHCLKDGTAEISLLIWIYLLSERFSINTESLSNKYASHSKFSTISENPSDNHT